MKKYLFFIVFIITALQFISCGGAVTDISGTWTKPGYSGKKYAKLLIVVITNDLVKRNSVESAVSSELKKEKISSSGSTTVLDLSKIEKNKEGKIDSTKLVEIKQNVIDAGYDGALVLSLLDVKEKTEYVPGQTYYQPTYYTGYRPYGYGYGGFYSYYYNTYNYVNTPGYYVEKKYIYIETRLWDLKKDEMVWASQSETMNPSNLSDFSGSLARAVVNSLLNDRVVR